MFLIILALIFYIFCEIDRVKWKGQLNNLKGIQKVTLGSLSITFAIGEAVRYNGEECESADCNV
jgi:hypothetical protein